MTPGMKARALARRIASLSSNVSASFPLDVHDSQNRLCRSAIESIWSP
jgi:hypothetical protein